jgi:rhodanese-related sulfurtransferase
MSVQSISPGQLNEAISRGKSVLLVDVRTPIEFREVHVACAVNMPLDQLSVSSVVSKRTNPDEPIYVICRSGGRGKQACEKLLAGNVTNVINVDGGTLACEKAGLPVIRGKKMMSLERQVRIAAGALVFSGVALSFIHPWWIFLSGFVGAGLVFAGVTDTCAMGMLIAKMPWNSVKAGA